MRLRHFVFIFFILLQFSVHAQSVGGITTGAATFCGNNNAGFVSLTGQTGTVVCWQTSTDNGTTWNSVFDSTITFSYNNLNLDTWFRAIVKDGSFPPDTSTISVITIHPATIAGTISGGGAFCQNSGNGNLTLSGFQSTSRQWESSINNGNTWQSLSNSSTTYSYSSVTQNTLYRVIAFNIPGCPSDTSASGSITIDALSVAGTLSASDTICKNNNDDTLRLAGYNGNALNWQLSTNNGTTWSNAGNTDSILIYHNIGLTTWYRVEVTNGVCPVVTTAPVKLVIMHPDTANAGDDQIIIQYKKTQLNGSGDGTAQWQPATGLDDASSFTTVAEPYVTTTYTLVLTDPYGCITRDSVTIQVVVQVPTAISPNNDGINDCFVINAVSDYPACSIEIYNRWGMKVYNAAPYDNKWNGVTSGGKDLPDDIYYYVFDYGTAAKGTASGYILIKR